LVESKAVKNIVTKYLGEHAVTAAKESTKTAAEKAEEEVLNFNGRKHIVIHPANRAPEKPSYFRSFARALSNGYHSLMSLGLSKRTPVSLHDLPKLKTKIAAKI
jgi:hypothetical protein